MLQSHVTLGDPMVENSLASKDGLAEGHPTVGVAVAVNEAVGRIRVRRVNVIVVRRHDEGSRLDCPVVNESAVLVLGLADRQMMLDGSSLPNLVIGASCQGEDAGSGCDGCDELVHGICIDLSWRDLRDSARILETGQVAEQNVGLPESVEAHGDA